MSNPDKPIPDKPAPGKPAANKPAPGRPTPGKFDRDKFAPPFRGRQIPVSGPSRNTPRRPAK